MEITPRQRPPRYFDLPTKFSLYLGGFYVYFGLFFLLIGSVVLWTLGGMGDWASITDPVKDNWPQTSGIINSLAETSASVNEQKVISYEYRYAVNGVSYMGTAYTTGKRFGQNQDVLIRYDPDEPEHSIMNDARRGAFAFWVVPIVLIFPLVGLSFFLFGLFRNKKGFELLQNGHFTRATPAAKDATMTRINNQTVYKYRFAFQVAGRDYEALCKTHICGPVEDEETEKVLYDPIDPKHNVVYDALSNAPAFDQFGKMVPNNWAKAWPLLLVIAVLVVNYIGMWYWGVL